MTPTPSGVRAVLLIPVLLLAAATAACASPTSSSSAPPPSAPATTTPSPTPTPVAGGAPAQTFGGACNSILSTRAVSTDLGATVVLTVPAEWGPSDYATESLGGVSCAWQDPTSKGGQFLDLIVLPAEAASDPTAKPLSCDTGGGQSECYFNAIDSGYWFSGRAVAKDGAGLAAIKTDTATLEAQLASAASGAGSPPAVTTVAGAWTKPSSCVALGTAAGVVAASGSPTLKPNALDTESDDPDGYYAGLLASSYLGCEWSSDAPVPSNQLSGFTVELAPGGAWAKPKALTTESVAVTIPGADSAYTMSSNGTINYLEVFDGPNWLAVEPYGGAITLAKIAPVITAVLKTLD